MTEYLITNGSVLIEDGTKTAEKADQYDVSRRVRVELSFAVGEGQSAVAVLDHVAKIADMKVHEMLGRKRTAASDIALNTAVTSAAGTVEEKPKATRTRVKPAEETKAPADELDLTAGPKAAVSQADELGLDLNAGSGVSEGGQDDDDMSWMNEEAPAAKEITDGELGERAQHKHKELQDGKPIRALLDKYNPDKTKVCQLRDIPQAKRQAFLDELAALKKA